MTDRPTDDLDGFSDFREATNMSHWMGEFQPVREVWRDVPIAEGEK